MVAERSNVSVGLFAKPCALEGESSCYFQFNIHPNSKHKKMWVSLESDNCKVLLQEESTMSQRLLQLDMSKFRRHSYPLLSNILSSLQIKATTKDRIVKDIILKAYKMLSMDMGEAPKLWLMTMKIEIFTVYLLEEGDLNYKRWFMNRGIAKLGEEERCSICLEEMGRGLLVTRMPCSHVFHGACISKWLRDRCPTCPICRFQVPTLA